MPQYQRRRSVQPYFNFLIGDSFVIQLQNYNIKMPFKDLITAC